MSKTPEELDILRAVSTAIRCKDYPAVEQYLNDGGNPDGFYGMTLLAQAVDAGCIEIAQLLLDHGADANAYGRSGKFPLYLAARNQTSDTVDILKLLVDRGADVNLKYVNGNTALMESVWVNDVVKAAVLVDAGADVLESNNGGDTVLHISALKGNADMTRLLIKAGAPVNLVKFRGRGEVPYFGIQPLHLSTYGGGYPDVARALLEAGAPVDAAESNGRTTLHHAAFRNAYRVVDVLLEYQCSLDPISRDNDEQKTPLMKAVDAGHTAIVNRLLVAGARLDTADVWGTTPLIAAVFTGKPEITKALIQSGCDVDEWMPNDNKFTPLRASLRHPPHITLMLVIAGCKVEPDVREFFDGQIQLPLSEHTVIFERLLSATSQPTSLAIQCRYLIRRRLGFFRVRVPREEGSDELVVMDKLDSLYEQHGIPRRVCEFIMCRELDHILRTFPYRQ